jgi:hypothetical protein
MAGRIFEKGPRDPRFLDRVKSGPSDLMVETPNGVRHSDKMNGMFVWEQSGLQEHQGALNSPTTLGSRGGKSGRKPAA